MTPVESTSASLPDAGKERSSGDKPQVPALAPAAQTQGSKVYSSEKRKRDEGGSTRLVGLTLTAYERQSMQLKRYKAENLRLRAALDRVSTLAEEKETKFFDLTWYSSAISTSALANDHAIKERRKAIVASNQEEAGELNSVLSKFYQGFNIGVWLAAQSIRLVADDTVGTDGSAALLAEAKLAFAKGNAAAAAAAASASGKHVGSIPHDNCVSE